MLLQHGLYAGFLHLLLLSVLFDIGIIRMALLGYVAWPAGTAGWSDFPFLSGCRPVGHLAADLASPCDGWKEEAITSTHPSCHHLIKPHGVGVNLTGWGLLANLMSATRQGPWRTDYRRLHGAKERGVHIGQYSLPVRSTFLAFPCVQLPWNLSAEHLHRYL